MQETVDEHEKIIEALKEKDDEKIYKALEEHLYNAANYVVKTFDKISI
jgi:DNA-binding GntR family transcriptional regulator